MASDDIWILGIAMTKFGKHSDKDIVDLGSEAAIAALADAGVTMADIGILAAGNLMGAGASFGQALQKQIGQTGIPVYNVANACATGATALRTAIMAVKSGEVRMGLAVGAEKVDHRAAHARHDAHVHGHVRAVGQLDADVGDRRAQRAHREGHDVHRAALHAAGVERVHLRVRLGRVHPVVVRACVGGVAGADEGQVLDARDVLRAGAVQVAVRVGLLVELLQRAIGQHACDERLVLSIAAIAPVDRGGTGERRDLGNPVVQCRQTAAGPSFDGGGGGRCLGCCFHEKLLRPWRAEQTGKKSDGRDERGHHVFDIGLELIVLHAGLVQLQVELQETDIGRIRESGAVLRVGAPQARLPEGGRQVIHAALGNAPDHRLHGGVVQRLEQLGVDDVRLEFVRDHLEQCAQTLTGIRDGFELAPYGFELQLLPALQSSHQQRVARGEVPVEAALGDTKATGQRLHGNRRHALLRDQVQRGLRPVVGAQAAAALRLAQFSFVHLPILNGRLGPKQYCSAA